MFSGKDVFEATMLVINNKKELIGELLRWIPGLWEDKEADNPVDWFIKVLSYLDKQKKLDGKRN